MTERLGFVGLGIMGLAMVKNLVRDEPLAVYNRTRARLKERPPQTTVQESPQAIAEVSDVIFLMLSNDAAVREVVEGPQGVLAGLQPGSLIIDHSTVSPQITREMAARVQALGADWCDAPVTGGDVGARQGTLTIMVGASPDDYRRAEPYLKRMGRRIYHVGTVGQGQSLKLVANMVSAINLMAASEGIQMGLSLGLQLEDIDEVMSHGSSQSFELAKVMERLTQNNFRPGFSVENRYKDLSLAVQLAKSIGFEASLANDAERLYGSYVSPDTLQKDESSYVRRWSIKEE